jgi:hypothetical protein
MTESASDLDAVLAEALYTDPTVSADRPVGVEARLRQLAGQLALLRRPELGERVMGRDDLVAQVVRFDESTAPRCERSTTISRGQKRTAPRTRRHALGRRPTRSAGMSLRSRVSVIPAALEARTIDPVSDRADERAASARPSREDCFTGGPSCRYPPPAVFLIWAESHHPHGRSARPSASAVDARTPSVRMVSNHPSPFSALVLTAPGIRQLSP